MNWRPWLRVKSRDPRALGRMVVIVLALGAAIGAIVDVYCPSMLRTPVTQTTPSLLPPPAPPLGPRPVPGPDSQPVPGPDSQPVPGPDSQQAPPADPGDPPNSAPAPKTDDQGSPHEEADPAGPDILEQEPRRSLHDASLQAEQAAQRGDWGQAWSWVWRYWRLEWGLVGPTLLAGMTTLCWLAFALQAVQPNRLRDERIIVCILAMGLGTLSTGLTHFFALWQETVWGVYESDAVAPGLRYFVMGVGLREEASKALCAVVFLPWLVWRRDGLGALMAFGCCGLGFALGENIGYIAQSFGSATLARLLMPSPLHMALTGLVGLAFYRGCRWPKECLPGAIGSFFAAVVVHGLYDALLSIPAIRDVAFAAWTLFVLLMWQFFRELRGLRSRRSDVVSFRANFLLCVSLTAAATFIYLSAIFDWVTAADLLMASALGEAAMAYLFLREMAED